MKSLGTSQKLWLFKRTPIWPCTGILYAFCSASHGEKSCWSLIGPDARGWMSTTPLLSCDMLWLVVQSGTFHAIDERFGGKNSWQCCRICVFEFLEIPMKLEFEFNGFFSTSFNFKKFSPCNRAVFPSYLPWFRSKNHSEMLHSSTWCRSRDQK